VTRLTKVELRRLFSRRLTRIGIAGAVVMIGVMLFAVFMGSRPLPAEQLASMRADYDRMAQSLPAEVERCKAEEKAQQGTDPSFSMSCEQMVLPPWEEWTKPETVFRETMPDVLLNGSYLLVFIAFLLGAGFIGAEYSSGSIGSWLTFEPRRLRVYGSKLLAASTGLIPVAAVFTTLLLLGSWVIIGHNGTTAGTTGEVWGDLAETAVRVVALTAVAAALGVVVGLLFRHTAAALGLAMAYLVLVEAVLGGVLTKVQPWLLRLNFESWVSHGATYVVEECTGDQAGAGYSCSLVEKQVSFGHGTLYLAVVTLVLVVAGALVFRRRDVT
jgi:ABC-2 type transport system permease protein